MCEKLYIISFGDSPHGGFPIGKMNNPLSLNTGYQLENDEDITTDLILEFSPTLRVLEATPKDTVLLQGTIPLVYPQTWPKKPSATPMIEEISKDRGFAGKNIQKAGSCSTDSN
jgi:hypothetical protein